MRASVILRALDRAGWKVRQEGARIVATREGVSTLSLRKAGGAWSAAGAIQGRIRDLSILERALRAFHFTPRLEG